MQAESPKNAPNLAKCHLVMEHSEAIGDILWTFVKDINCQKKRDYRICFQVRMQSFSGYYYRLEIIDNIIKHQINSKKQK